jgi:hypothetical protein
MLLLTQTKIVEVYNKEMVTDESVQLKVTTQFSGFVEKPLKEPRSVIFDKVFIVKD